MSSEIETENTSSAAAAGQPPPTAGMTTKVVKGSLWTLAGQVAPLGVSLVTTPFTIRLLGAEGYGVLVLIGLIPTYLGFADFGMSMASTKFGSEAYAEGDPEKEARIIRTAAAIALASSLPVAALLMIFAGTITGLFNVPEHLAANATAALRIAAVGMVINFLCGIFNTPQLARLRMDLNTLITAIPRILGQIATPIAIYLGYGITGAMAALLAASVLTLAGHLIISRRFVPLSFRIAISREDFQRLFRFGLHIVFGAMAGLILINAEKGVLAVTVSPTSLAYYSVAFTFAGLFTMISGSLLQSLIPAFSQLQSKDRRPQLEALFSLGIRSSLLWIVPAIVLMTIFAEPIITLWAGRDFGSHSVLPLHILLIGITVNTFNYIPSSILLAAGRADLISKLYWVELFPYLLLVYFLSLWYGAIGAAAAWTARVIADVAAHFIMLNRCNALRVSGRAIKWFLLAIALILAAILMAYYYRNSFSPALMIIIGLFLAVYQFAAIKSLVQKDEVRWLVAKFRSRFGFINTNENIGSNPYI